jgi:Lrp/AsnC family transcriptional regulator, leucine-responsive regulatory protein
MYEYSKNSHVGTSMLGTKLKISQQSASYLIGSYKRKRIIQQHTIIIDPARLGYMSLIVYYNFTDFNTSVIQEVISSLQTKDDVIGIQRLEQGYDLACIYCVPNLSHFNKSNRDFLQKFQKTIFTAGILPIVVSHLYPKNYLVAQKQPTEIIIRGDRDVIDMSVRKKKLLNHLYDNPLSTVLDASRKLNLDPKTIVKLKFLLEKTKVIRGFSAILDYSKLGISRRYILLRSNDFTFQKDKQFVEFCKVHPHIVGLTRLIGHYDLLADVEGENLSRKDVLKEIRVEFGVKEYQVLPVSNILKQKYVPRAALD